MVIATPSLQECSAMHRCKHNTYWHRPPTTWHARDARATSGARDAHSNDKHPSSNTAAILCHWVRGGRTSRGVLVGLYQQPCHCTPEIYLSNTISTSRPAWAIPVQQCKYRCVERQQKTAQSYVHSASLPKPCKVQGYTACSLR